MLVTVAICTRDRAALLEQGLTALTGLALPAGVDWELLVVNNGSRDHTDAVIAAFASKLPIRRLFEPHAGLSRARNLAVRHARGAYILWTDDDALVSREWLTHYVAAFRRWPEAALFGGPVVPWFEESPPSWLRQVWPRVAHAYAVLAYGEEPTPLGGGVLPFGVNMVVRRDYQARFPYDPTLGRAPGRLIPGEETAVASAILGAGAPGWWLPLPSVRHFIPAERMTTRYLRNYFSGCGEFLGRFSPDRVSRPLFGRPRWLWRHAVQSELRYRVRRVTHGSSVWIEDLRAASLAWGRLRGQLPANGEGSTLHRPVRA